MAGARSSSAMWWRQNDGGDVTSNPGDSCGQSREWLKGKSHGVPLHSFEQRLGTGTHRSDGGLGGGVVWPKQRMESPFPCVARRRKVGGCRPAVGELPWGVRQPLKLGEKE